jgi:ATP-binding cassette subfamily B protein
VAEFRDLLAKYQYVEFLGNLAFALLSVIAIYLAMSRAAFSIVDGRLTIGDLAIYGSAAAQLRGLVESSIALVARLRWDILHIGNVRAFLALPPEGPRRAATQRMPLRGGIAFRQVTFTYPGSAQPTRPCGLVAVAARAPACSKVRRHQIGHGFTPRPIPLP